MDGNCQVLAAANPDVSVVVMLEFSFCVGYSNSYHASFSSPLGLGVWYCVYCGGGKPAFDKESRLFPCVALVGVTAFN